jgi:hypothetical protein
MVERPTSGTLGRSREELRFSKLAGDSEEWLPECATAVGAHAMDVDCCPVLPVSRTWGQPLATPVVGLPAKSGVRLGRSVQSSSVKW